MTLATLTNHWTHMTVNPLIQLKRGGLKFPCIYRVGDTFRVTDIRHTCTIEIQHTVTKSNHIILGDDELQRYFKFATVTK